MTAAEREDQWKQMKTILQKTTAEVDGLSTRKHQDWFDKADKETQKLFEKKRSFHNYPLERFHDQAAKAAYKTLKYSADRQGSHPPALFIEFRRSLQ